MRKSTATWIRCMEKHGAALHPTLPEEDPIFGRLLRADPETTDVLSLRWSPIPETCWDITEALRKDGWVTTAIFDNRAQAFLVGATRPKEAPPEAGQSDLQRFT